MSTFYEVSADGESEFYLSYRQAMWAAKDAAKVETIVRLERIETPRINKDLVLSVLNGRGYVEKRETLALFEYGKISESIAAPGSRVENL